MAQLANQVDELDTLLDGARYGDLGDVQTGLDEYKISVDAVDEQQRTGKWRLQGPRKSSN